MNIRFIINIFGRVLILLGLFMLTPIIWAFVYGEDTVGGILASSLITLAAGTFMYFGSLINLRKELGLRDSYFTVTFTWVVISLFGMLPYIFTGSIEGLPNVYFETVSGFTTTGSTILTDIESLPKSILFWRSLSQWIGGMGIIVLVVAILPLLRIGGYNLFKSEASGISYEKLTPKTASTAKRLWGIYVALTIILIPLLLIGGMSFFDSLNHAFTVMAAGGFSTKDASIGAFSPFVQYVVILFMLLAGMNFYLHYHFIKGRFKRVFSNIELKTYLSIVGIVTIAITIAVYLEGTYNLEYVIRKSFFQVTSILTTSGFATYDYLLWPTPAWTLLFLLMFVGACVGSTGGGIKVIRHVVSFRSVVLHFKRMLHPNSVSLLKINGEVIDDEKVSSLITFLVLYLFTFISGSIIMVFLGLDTFTAVGAVAANLGGVGPGIGTVGPAANYHHIHDAGKIVLSFLMIIGRLELTTVIILFTSMFWDKYR
ncbi:TrkH family potassium uptake protein [Alkalitalea saponilacus]|uniref:Trk system potassium uptake protein TrkH n=1 Tax=Alkalitalea saponilacus TaxID=889453 RepID=A0A1T5CD43_9BACT|nr:TrkH family potassium uptake protein [Alkalitalea saponilacus]ASB49817.1 potassium transporter [Alkalitalea saponilacus]SKB57266.1 trk system potassium uptake protein TrkH [Alkalitalea saponilacus]